LKSATTIDLEHRGRQRYVAAGLLEGDREVAVIDPGPSATLEVLRQKLHARGIAISDIGSVLLTHIHLDHAGVTGVLIEENPRIRVYVHQRGAPHLIDPRRLLESGSRVLGGDVQEYWGRVAPVPASNVHILNGGEEISVGNRQFEAFYTPGHAVHHVCFFEPASKIAFVGDTAGIRIGDSIVYPATPPPDVHLPLLHESLTMIEARKPEQLFLTHFGLVGKVEWHFAELRERIDRWSEFVRASLEQPGDDALREKSFADMVSAELRSVLDEDEVVWFQSLVSNRQNWHGLARYWRRQAETTSNPSTAIKQTWETASREMR
jgi:glyoxylase-like metal-dependent hydrolase (beta-lactamase superfamily II)